MRQVQLGGMSPSGGMHKVRILPAQILCLTLHTQVRAGHGAGKPTAKVIEEAADLYGTLNLHPTLCCLSHLLF
jgi:hypothetical protein